MLSLSDEHGPPVCEAVVVSETCPLEKERLTSDRSSTPRGGGRAREMLERARAMLPVVVAYEQ